MGRIRPTPRSHHRKEQLTQHLVLAFVFLFVLPEWDLFLLLHLHLLVILTLSEVEGEEPRIFEGSEATRVRLPEPSHKAISQR